MVCIEREKDRAVVNVCLCLGSHIRPWGWWNKLTDRPKPVQKRGKTFGIVLFLPSGLVAKEELPRRNLIGQNCISKWIWIRFGLWVPKRQKTVARSASSPRALHSDNVFKKIEYLWPSTCIAVIKRNYFCFFHLVRSLSIHLEISLTHALRTGQENMKRRLIEFFTKIDFSLVRRATSPSRMMDGQLLKITSGFPILAASALSH